MAKKKSPEKVESKESESLDVAHVPEEIVEKVQSDEHVQESDLAKHPKFAKFNSNRGK